MDAKKNLYMLDGTRMPEETPGGPDRPGWINVKRVDSDATATIIVSAVDVEVATEATKLVEAAICDVARKAYVADHRVEAAEIAARRAYVAQTDARARLDAVLTGKARIWGEALVVLADDGSAWLQDPKKRDAGFGFRYPSLADLWRAWPDLRPVRWAGGDLIVASGPALKGDAP